MMKKKKLKVACFGEVLWDIFQDGTRKIGGAPFNVAYNLHKMGLESTIISSVGNDDLGKKIIDKIENWGISIEGIQVLDTHPTSTVVASIDENNDATYDIVKNVAWDHISTIQKDLDLVSKSDALVYGTLASRSQKSKNTLFELIEASRYNVFDINLRAPHYDVKLIKDLLHKTQLAKFNKAELRLMLDFLGKEYKTEQDSIRYLQDLFRMREIIISKGSKGALYAYEDEFHLYPVVKVDIKDTIGSGDSFLAGFLSKRLEMDNKVHDIMHQAVALGAFITAREGACPEYEISDFISFRDGNQVKPMNL